MLFGNGSADAAFSLQGAFLYLWLSCFNRRGGTGRRGFYALNPLMGCRGETMAIGCLTLRPLVPICG